MLEPGGDELRTGSAAGLGRPSYRLGEAAAFRLVQCSRTSRRRSQPTFNVTNLGVIAALPGIAYQATLSATGAVTGVSSA